MVTARLPFRSYHRFHEHSPESRRPSRTAALEDDAAIARGGFACLFSTSDEYESALISERRAQGRYARPNGRWPIVLFVGCALMVLGTAAADRRAECRRISDCDGAPSAAPFSLDAVCG